MRDAVPKAWLRYKYFDSRAVLVKLGAIEVDLIERGASTEMLSLRSRTLRPIHEKRQGALFAFGISQYLGRPVSYAPVEDDDFDCVLLWEDADTAKFTPVQLKEFPPASINPKVDLEDELRKLAKYSDGRDLAVAYYLNRQFHLELSEIAIPPLRIGSLWFYGGVNAEKTRWMIWGDLLANPRSVEYDYPS